MKWLYIEGKFIPVRNCVKIDFTNVQRDREYAITMIVEDTNSNITKSTFYSKIDKINEDDVRDRFYTFIIDDSATVFYFYSVCKSIEQINS